MPKIVATFTMRHVQTKRYRVELDVDSMQLARMARNKDAVQAAWEAYPWGVVGKAAPEDMGGGTEMVVNILWPVEAQ